MASSAITTYINAQDLGLNPQSGKEQDAFCWLLASFLFGKHVQQNIAAQAYHKLTEAGCTSAGALQRLSWQELVQLLDEAHYVRYDESTARYLLEMAGKLLRDYEGKVTRLITQSADRQDLGRRLQQFKGIGPKTTEIFLREIAKTTELYKSM